MVVFILLGLTLVLALGSMFLLWIAAARPLQYSRSLVFLSLSLALFVYLYGAWVFLSVYAKYTFGALFVLVVIAAMQRKRKDNVRLRPAWTHWANRIIAIVLCVLIVLYFTGTTGLPRQVKMGLPFKHGHYFVLQGGKGLPTNLFHYSLRGAVYAMDIVKLDQYGRRANTVFSSNLHDYVSFGDTIYAPCDGHVIGAFNTNPDNIPPNMKRGPTNTNQVLLETSTCYIFMGHMRKGSVMVRVNDWVKKGDPLGCIGNSGFSAEPHLHIQVHMKDGNTPWYKCPPLYILFDEKGYLLNEVINADKQ
ncbi:Peptidase family M23 [Chitinophaga costaii]|uniref:Peptidase family M23 n=1 Tax=Chitinophaga costaii TaxID=1335309 RepID=A0A1C4E7H7_9BACT|nr:M23 family metallopeptidase [Chitinophaga costaii]PUZ24271.1 M23 family peptidase [Chitinophaga costaii]SCC39524.1 Peptidase family M23 [Chitinophaga costaii]